jgi:hypothetical protein
VYNYLQSDERRIGAERLESMRSLISELEADELQFQSLQRVPSSSAVIFPLPLHPSPNGIFPWGFSQDWWDFFWICQGQPNEWGVLATYKSVEEVYQFPGLSLLRFFIELVHRPFDERFRLTGSFLPQTGSTRDGTSGPS